MNIRGDQMVCFCRETKSSFYIRVERNKVGERKGYGATFSLVCPGDRLFAYLRVYLP